MGIRGWSIASTVRARPNLKVPAWYPKLITDPNKINYKFFRITVHWRALTSPPILWQGASVQARPGLTNGALGQTHPTQVLVHGEHSYVPSHIGSINEIGLMESVRFSLTTHREPNLRLVVGRVTPCAPPVTPPCVRPGAILV